MVKSQPRRVFESLEALLVESRCLSPEQVYVVRQFQTENGVNFGTAVMFLQLVEPAVIGELLGKAAGVRQVRLAGIQLSAGVKNLLAVDAAKALQVFPLGLIDDSGTKIVLMGMTDPLDRDAVARAQLAAGISVQPAFLQLSDLQALYKKYYHSGLSLFPSEVTSAGEKTVNRRLDSFMKAPSPTPGLSNGTSLEVRALVRVLVDKGLITEAEYLRALKLEKA